VPAAEPTCATSPTRVIDRVGQRRISRRHIIGESSCASSTTTWPNAQVRSLSARSATLREGPESANRAANVSALTRIPSARSAPLDRRDAAA
jgi:hypothetical protein